MKMSKLLINEPPLQVLPSLAVAIGLNEAIFLQQLHYWLTPTVKYKPHYKEYEGAIRPWIYNTYDTKKGEKETGWKSNFPFWSVRTIKRIVTSLKEKGLILATDQFNTAPSNRTLWYTIDYAKLEMYESTSGTLDSDKLALSEGDKLALSREGQIGTLMTETTTETTTENMAQSAADDFSDILPDEPQQAPSPKPKPKKLNDNGKAHLLAFGVLADDKPDPEVYAVRQEMQTAGWEMHSTDIELAIVYFVLAVRDRHPGFKIPNDTSSRKHWYRSINGHLQNYALSELQDLYKRAIIKMEEKNLSYWVPGSLTNWGLPEAANKTAQPTSEKDYRDDPQYQAFADQY
jgi:hypothetical protein